MSRRGGVYLSKDVADYEYVQTAREPFLKLFLAKGRVRVLKMGINLISENI